MISQFALRLICGMSLMWALMPRRDVTSGFFRIQMLVVMGLGVLAALAAGMNASTLTLASGLVTQWVSGTICVAGFVGSVVWKLERRVAGERIGFGILAASASLLIGHQLTRDSWRSGVEWLSPVSQIVGGAVLGSVTVGMLLGHWYLTAPTMSIEPLKRINAFVGLTGGLRLIVSATVLGLLWSGPWPASEPAVRLPAVAQVWLVLRWLAGIIGPIVISLMVWRILKYRNTQAATGVLFVGVILVFLGDLMAALLLQETKLPF